MLEIFRPDRFHFLLPVALAAGLAQLAWAQTVAAETAAKADLIVSHARVFTGSYTPGKPGASAQPETASAMAVAGGKIIFVGDEKAAAAFKSPSTTELNLRGKLVLPGFHDCHVHLCEGSFERDSCLLNGSKTKAEALAKIKAFAAKHPKKSEGAWFTAAGMPLPAVATTPLTKEDLDKIESSRPVLVLSEDAHSMWLNSKALRLCKIDATTKDPEAGTIEHEKDGSPNGCLREEAMELTEGVVPVEPLEKRTTSLKKAVLLANSLGITSIQDAHARDDILETYYALADKGELNLKVVAALHTGVGFKDADYDHLVELRQKYTKGNLRATSAKIFSDGVIETHTAALIDPYCNDKENRGRLYLDPERLKQAVIALDKRGFQVHIHAIGDRAVRTALDAYQAAKAANPGEYEKHRHQMAHLEVIQKADIPRFQALAVIANFESYWAFNDPYMTELTVPALGPERMKLIYQIRSVLDTGATLSGGSDWTVSTLSPLKAMQIATTRHTPGQPRAKVLLPEERVELKDILAAYTTGGAWANHSDDSTGSLSVGKAADFIVMEQDIFAVKPDVLGSVRVLKTYLDGKLVFDRARPEDSKVRE